jgi:hypothetical protein
VKIYFAAAIRGGRDDKDLYEKIVRQLQTYGKVLTEHIGDKTLSDLGEQDVTPQYIYNRDIDWVKESDVVVAEVTQPSLGVGYEIAKAEEWGKRILCLFRPSSNKRLSAMILGSDNIEVKEYQTIAEAGEILKDFFM